MEYDVSGASSQALHRLRELERARLEISSKRSILEKELHIRRNSERASAEKQQAHVRRQLEIVREEQELSRQRNMRLLKDLQQTELCASAMNQKTIRLQAAKERYVQAVTAFWEHDTLQTAEAKRAAQNLSDHFVGVPLGFGLSIGQHYSQVSQPPTSQPLPSKVLPSSDGYRQRGSVPEHLSVPVLATNTPSEDPLVGSSLGHFEASCSNQPCKGQAFALGEMDPAVGEALSHASRIISDLSNDAPKTLMAHTIQSRPPAVPRVYSHFSQSQTLSTKPSAYAGHHITSSLATPSAMSAQSTAGEGSLLLSTPLLPLLRPTVLPPFVPLIDSSVATLPVHPHQLSSRLVGHPSHQLQFEFAKQPVSGSTLPSALHLSELETTSQGQPFLIIPKHCSNQGLVPFSSAQPAPMISSHVSTHVAEEEALQSRSIAVQVDEKSLVEDEHSEVIAAKSLLRHISADGQTQDVDDFHGNQRCESPLSDAVSVEMSTGADVSTEQSDDVSSELSEGELRLSCFTNRLPAVWVQPSLSSTVVAQPTVQLRTVRLQKKGECESDARVLQNAEAVQSAHLSQIPHSSSQTEDIPQIPALHKMDTDDSYGSKEGWTHTTADNQTAQTTDLLAETVSNFKQIDKVVLDVKAVGEGGAHSGRQTVTGTASDSNNPDIKVPRSCEDTSKVSLTCVNSETVTDNVVKPTAEKEVLDQALQLPTSHFLYDLTEEEEEESQTSLIVVSDLKLSHKNAHHLPAATTLDLSTEKHPMETPVESVPDTRDESDVVKLDSAVGLLKVLLECVVTAENISVLEVESLYRPSSCSVVMAERILTAAQSCADMSCFDPNAVSSVVLDHLRHIVFLCGECARQSAGSHGPCKSNQPPQLGLIPDLMLRKHAELCTSEIEFRSQLVPPWMHCWPLLLAHWQVLISHRLLTANEISAIFAPVLISTHIRHPKKLEKAVATLENVLSDCFADLLESSEDSLDLSSTTLPSELGLSSSPAPERRHVVPHSANIQPISDQEVANLGPSSNSKPLTAPSASLHDASINSSKSSESSHSHQTIAPNTADLTATIATKTLDSPSVSVNSAASAVQVGVGDQATAGVIKLKENEKKPRDGIFSSDTDSESDAVLYQPSAVVEKPSHQAAGFSERKTSPGDLLTAVGTFVTTEEGTEVSSEEEERPNAGGYKPSISPAAQSNFYRQFVGQFGGSLAENSSASDDSVDDLLFGSRGPSAATISILPAAKTPLLSTPPIQRASPNKTNADSSHASSRAASSRLMHSTPDWLEDFDSDDSSSIDRHLQPPAGADADSDF